ncbi:MAG: hypothetical protein ACTSR2_04550 [Candidatus Hodarchaeales archaeon]
MVNFNQRYDMAFKCPRCHTITDKNRCPICKYKLGEKDEYFLRRHIIIIREEKRQNIFWGYIY